MTTKLQNYIQLAGQTAAQVTKTPKNWVYFLNTASRLYRYPFPDQLMIHAQRPKATACAGYDLWNKRMSRYVRRGSKGIGLVGINRSGYPKLRYVFDIADTGKKDESSSLFQWQYKEEYRGIIIKALEEQFGVSGEKGLLYQLEMIAVKLANDYWKYYHKDLVYECEGSFLEVLEESAVSVKFRLAAAASISYVLFARCGYDPWQYLKSKDFRDIPDFNTQRIIRVLGAAVSESSEQVLRTIAVTIYHHEYQKLTVPNTSRSVQPYRVGSDSQPTKAPEQEDNSREPEPDTAEAIQEDDTKEPESANTESIHEDNTKEPESANIESIQEDDTKAPELATAEAIQEDNTKAPEPVTDVTTDTEQQVPTDTEVVQDISDAQKIPAPVPRNFTITDDHLGEGGPKAKFQMNMEAIRTLKQIESESRTATPDEQEILSKYVGWGGIPDAFEPNKAGWEKEYQELNAALTPEEYTSARQSTLNAHYTSPAVIKAMYQAVGDMGFTSGNILEPSCAIGNFFGLLPEEMSESKLYGVELDSISGRIAKLL